MLPIYHQLLKSESPGDIQIIEVQNGSIDFVLNLDIDVALDLVELFKLGFKGFAAYLSYKKLLEPIVRHYHGNKKLIRSEEEREKLLLENIGTAIQERIKKQHADAKKADTGVNKTAIPKKIEQVTKLIASHIIKGNDMKLLSIPARGETEEGGEEVPDERDALRKESMEARRQLRLMSTEAHQKLLEAYGRLEEEEE